MIFNNNNWDDVRNFYEVLDEIGKGTTGKVYRARTIGSPCIVAVKVSKTLRKEEAEALLTVFQQTGLAPEPYAYGRDYIVMALVDGVQLRVCVKKTQQLDELLPILTKYVDLCEALTKVGVVHGDPHWGNVLVKDDGTMVAVDFGNANQLAEEITMSKLFVAALGHMAIIAKDVYSELMEDFEFSKIRTPRTTSDLRKAIQYVENKIQVRVA